MARSLLTVLIGVAVNSVAAPGPNRPPTEAEQIFSKHVKPMLAAKCQVCHGSMKVSGFNSETRESLLAGGHRGAAIVPGQAAKSLLVAALEQGGALKMPPGQKLSDETIAAVRRWIDLGAPWVEGDAQPASAVAAPNADPGDTWAFRPVKHYDPPAIKDHAAVLSPIDAFVLRKLNEAGLQAAPRADRLTLIRRATFDLTGLPPTPAEVADFLHDPSSDPEAFTKVVERLLASPRYGERWARHWLDVARYADTGGYSNDFERPNAWRYREYVIRSFNHDKPYNQFVREQIAGDEIDPRNPENLVATGFLRIGPWEQTGMSVAAETRQAWLDDVTQSTGATFLGLTLECARCHDHKFDPLPTKDYYSMQAVFATTEFADRPAPFLESELRDDFAAGRARLQELIRGNNARIAEFDDLTKQRLAAKKGVTVGRLSKEEVAAAILKKDLITADEFEVLKVYVKRKELYVQSVMRYEPFAFSVSNGPFEPKQRKDWSMPETFILPIGNLKTPGERVTPGVLNATFRIGGEPSVEIDPAAVSRRLALADWLVDARNPLTPRVIVNRVWGYHFGKGIAANPNNLGKMGKRPTHPELLDYLAESFVQHGWSIKAMHRLIMLSSAYQRASAPAQPERLQKADPANNLLSYFPTRRLEAEELRDSILQVSGELSGDTGGPGAFPEINRDVANQPQQIMGTLMPAHHPSPTRRERNRRTIYTFQKRNLTDPFLDVFNGPSLDASTEQRIATIVPTQAFALLNSEMIHDAALAFAARLASAAKDRDQQTREAFRVAYNRLPSDQEMSLARAHLAKMTTYHQRVGPPSSEPRKPLVRGITSELTGAEVLIEEASEPGRYEENLKPADVPPETRALADLALALFNSNEFLYVR